MTEYLGAVDTLPLEALEAGSRLKVSAGTEPDVYSYDFLVLKPGEKPLCLLMQTAPDGSMTGPGKAYLEGTGTWTDRSKNPVQTQEKAMTISYGHMRVGRFVMIIDANNPSPYGLANRYQLLPECTKMEVLESIVEKPQDK